MKLRPVWLSLSLLLAFAPVARSTTPAEVPNPRTANGSWVADMANVITAEQRDAIDARVNALRAACGAEIAVVTVDNTSDQVPKAFATELFNAWHIGNAERDNGVLMLVVMNPHRVEVETGYGAEGVLPDGKVGGILDRVVVPEFRNDHYGAGIAAGVNAMAHELERDAAYTGPRLPRNPLARFGLEALGVLLTLLAGIGTWRWRSRIRHCPECHQKMRWIDPDAEQAFLSKAEITEEKLRSVDHRVWYCDHCQASRVEHARRLFSAYRDCPSCKRRTLSVRTQVMLQATYERAGRAEVTSRCEMAGCKHEEVHTVKLPKLVHSTSSSGGGSGGGGSSGGSFGGGSSGGGGAGRSW